MLKAALLLVLLFFFGLAMGTVVTCNNPEYADQKLEFFYYPDPISKNKKHLFSLEFDASGKSSFQINNKATVYAFCDFGIYRGMVYLEPEQKQEIKLPPKREKSFADQKNPYFTPLSFWFKTENENQLNNHLSAFTQQFNRLTDQYFNQIYFRQSKTSFDSLVYFVNRDFGHVTSREFEFHKSMKLKLVEIEAFRLKAKQYSELFSTIKPKFWLYPAFIDVFDKTFNGELSFVVKSIKGKETALAVGRGDIQYLQTFVQNNYNITGDMADLVLLKMLHDGFYSGDFQKSTITKLIEHPVFKNHSNTIIKEAATNVYTKIIHLQKGTRAPAICLNIMDGQKFCTDSETQKFKYIVFADVEMIVCREHLKYLIEIDKRFNKNLDIYIVLRNTDLKGIQKFLDENEISGLVLIDTKNEYIKQYKVKSFPQCFLLNEKHEVQFSMTKSPLDNFEQQFGPFLRNELFMRQRNQSQ